MTGFELPVRPKDELKAELTLAESKVKELTKKRDAALKELMGSSIYLVHKNEYMRLDVERDRLRKRMSVLDSNAWGKIVDDGKQYVYFKDASSICGTNINPYLLNAIKSNLKISLLRSSDVIQLVNIIHKKLLENTEYCTLRQQFANTDKLYDEHQTAMWDIRRDAERLYNDEIRALHDTIHSIRQQLDRPDLIEAEQKRIAERSRIDDPNVVAAVLQDFLKTRRSTT